MMRGALMVAMTTVSSLGAARREHRTSITRVVRGSNASSTGKCSQRVAWHHRCLCSSGGGDSVADEKCLWAERELFVCAGLLDLVLPEVPRWGGPGALARRAAFFGGNPPRARRSVVAFVVAASQEMSASVEALRAQIPGLIVLSNKNNERWASYLRFLGFVLASDVEFGVLLREDAEISQDFTKRVMELVRNMTRPEQRLTYRLGRPGDAGLLVPRRAIGRALGVACAQVNLTQSPDEFGVADFDEEDPPFGQCKLTYVGRPYAELVRGRTNDTRPIGRVDSSLLCGLDYPGKVSDPSALHAEFWVKDPQLQVLAEEFNRRTLKLRRTVDHTERDGAPPWTHACARDAARVSTCLWTSVPDFFPCLASLDRQLPDVPENQQRAGDREVLFAVAAPRGSDPGLVAHLASRIPGLVVFDETDNATIRKDFELVGVRIFIPSLERTAWWLTYLRFVGELLVKSDKSFGVLLRPSAVVKDDFVDRVYDLIRNMSVPEQRASYFLGPEDVGELVPRSAAARILGVACARDSIWQTKRFFQSRPIKPAVGQCRLTYGGSPYEDLVALDDSMVRGKMSSMLPEVVARCEADLAYRPAADFSSVDQNNQSLCRSDYPGRVDRSLLIVQNAWPGGIARAQKVHNHVTTKRDSPTPYVPSTSTKDLERAACLRRVPWTHRCTCLATPNCLWTSESHFFPCAGVLHPRLPKVGGAWRDNSYSGWPATKNLPPGEILYVAAVLQSDRIRVEHVENFLRPVIPDLVIFNSTEKSDTLRVRRDFELLGARIDQPRGPTAWWLTYLRFLAFFLTTDYEFAVLFQDDALVPNFFLDRIQDLVRNMTPPEERFTYRLGKWDVGQLIPRQAIGRILGIVCGQDVVFHPTDGFHAAARMGNDGPTGQCPLTFGAQPYNGLVQRERKDATPTNIKNLSDLYNPRDDWPPPNTRPASLCGRDYPGKVHDPALLAAQFWHHRAAFDDLATTYNHQTVKQH